MPGFSRPLRRVGLNVHEIRAIRRIVAWTGGLYRQ
jgi:hypothetical protein